MLRSLKAWVPLHMWREALILCSEHHRVCQGLLKQKQPGSDWVHPHTHTLGLLLLAVLGWACCSLSLLAMGHTVCWPVTLKTLIR